MTTCARFMQKVQKQTAVTSPHVATPCWLWTGSKSGSGYGQFWNGKRTIPAHWFLVCDFMPSGKEACHRCDTKLCVNPDHIFIGSRQDNEQDKVSKGRHNTTPGCRAMLRIRSLKTGSQNHEAKLLESEVQVIKAIKPAYGLGRILAKRFGVSETVISGIWKGKRWPQVQPDELARQRAEAFLKCLGKWID